MLRRIFCAALFMLTLFALSACSTQEPVSPDASSKVPSGESSGVIEVPDADKKELSIICTVFPAYDWVRNLLGVRAGEVELTYLLESGTDMHSFQPSTEDMVKIASCDLFICVGGSSDKWVDDALRGAANEKQIVLKLMDVMHEKGLALPVAPVEGMQEKAHEHDVHEGEYDEHIWLSPVCASGLVAAIGDALCAVDAENAAIYRDNCRSYQEELAALDEAFGAAAAEGTKEAILVADRFAFRYLVHEYGIGCYAAFDACSAETEASFETVVFLASKVDELGLSVLLTTDDANGAVAKTVAASTESKDQEILALSSMQSVSRAQVDAGTTYLGMMKENLEVLRRALA